MDAAAPLPSTERQGRRTACVALSATAGAVVLGIIVSLAVGPGGVEVQGAAAAAAGPIPPPALAAMGGPASSSSPVVRALDGNDPTSSSTSSSSNRWFDCPPGVAPAAGAGTDAAASVSFLVLGDWGRQGNANQLRASDALADVSACLAPSFVVSTGDNFYPEGLLSADDDQFFRSFVDVYGSAGGGDPAGRARLARLPFYAALGNHDVTEGRQGGPGGPRGRFQLSASLEASAKNGLASSGRWHCYNGTWSVPSPSRGVSVAAAGPATTPTPGGSVEAAATADAGEPVSFATATTTTSTTTTTRPLLDLIVIDTNPFVGGPDGTWRQGEREASMAEVREGLERRLRASRAAWRLVVGHHPLHSLGKHCYGDPYAGHCAKMAWLRPLLQDHGVAAYFSGHEHDLQLIFETEEEGGAKEEGRTDGGAGQKVVVSEGGAKGGVGQARWPAFVVSGAGSDIRTNEFRTLPNGDETPVKLPPAGLSAPFVADQQGFVAAVANSTHLALHYYALKHRLPAHTTVLARRQ